MFKTVFLLLNVPKIKINCILIEGNPFTMIADKLVVVIPGCLLTIKNTMISSRLLGQSLKSVQSERGLQMEKLNTFYDLGKFCFVQVIVKLLTVIVPYNGKDRATEP